MNMYVSMDFLKNYQLLLTFQNINSYLQIFIYFINIYIYNYKYFSSEVLQTTLQDGEVIKRLYLVYLINKRTLFCIPCSLFKSTSVFSITGFFFF